MISVQQSDKEVHLHKGRDIISIFVKKKISLHPTKSEEFKNVAHAF